VSSKSIIKGLNDKTGHIRGAGPFAGTPIEHNEDPVFNKLLGNKAKANVSGLRGYDDKKAKRTDWSRGK
jgi:hypothetical protein